MGNVRRVAQHTFPEQRPSRVTANRVLLMHIFAGFGIALGAGYATFNLISRASFFLVQNIALVVFFGLALLLLRTGRPHAAFDFGFLPAMLAYSGSQTAWFVIRGSENQLVLFLPILLVLNTHLAALLGTRTRHVLIAFAISVASLAVGVVYGWDTIVGNTVAGFAIAIVTGLTLVIAVESRRMSSLAEREMRLRDDLVREVHHRLKNETGILLGLIDSEIDLASSPDVTEALRRERRRVTAVLSTHAHLYRTDDHRTLPLSDYLDDLARPFTHDYRAAGAAIKIVQRSEGIRMTPSDATTVGLIVSELLVNSVKHAFPGGVGRVELEVRGLERGVVIEYADNGVGMPEPRPAPAEPDAASGFGMQFVRRLVASLRGSITVDGSNGYRATVSLPEIRWSA